MKMALVVTILVAVAGRFMGDEVRAWSGWLHKWIRRIAVTRLPASIQDRYSEEWESALEEIPGEIFRLFFSMGLLTAAAKIREQAAIRPRSEDARKSLPSPARENHSFDRAYMESLSEGDPATVDHFVGYFTELLHLKLRSRLQSPDSIDDVRQETFVRVFSVLRKGRGLEKPENLGAFVNSVCNNVLFEHYRRSSRR